MKFIVSPDAMTQCEFLLVIDTIAILNLLINFVHSNIVPFQNKKEHDNFICKLRHFSDGFYPWGSQGRKSDMMACDQT